MILFSMTSSAEMGAHMNDLLEEVGRIPHGGGQNKNKDYNIFRVLGVSQMEKVMCRMLADLLSPEGSHGQRAVYLKSFLEQVLHRELPEEELESIQVYTEYPIPVRKRIDLVLKGTNCFIPIEVKIEAFDQNSQCYDYYQYAHGMDENTKIVYLTKDGRMPEEYSLTSADGKDMLHYDKLLCISFAEDIILWLEKILSEESGAMKLVLQQYLEAVRDFTVDEEKMLYEEIAEVALASEASLRTVLDIHHSMPAIKSALVHHVMEELETQMGKSAKELGLEREKKYHYWEYENEEYGGLNYVLSDISLTKGRELWLRIDYDEKEGTLFAGLCVFETEKDGVEGMGGEAEAISKKLEKELSQYITPESDNAVGWWYTWWYLPTGSDSLQAGRKYVPDFNHMNEIAVALADEKKRKKFAKECVKRIEKKLKKIRN